MSEVEIETLVTRVKTKLDDSYPTAQFDHPGYNIYRKERSKNGGGILVYTRAELPIRRLVNIEPTNIEGIVLEATFVKTKWAIVTTGGQKRGYRHIC